MITKTSELLLELTEAAFDVKAETIQFSDTDRVNCKIRADKDAFHAALEDGTYTATFKSDSSMFHVNEAYEDKGTLTVKDGQMTIHVTLVSKKIVNLFPGTAEDAQKEGAVLLQPTTDEVTYKDGTTGEAYGFDIPVPAIGEEFDCALIGEKGVWYDHKVTVTDPVKAE